MPYVKRTASGRIASVYDRPSREAKERVRANDPELLRFLGLAPTQSALAAEHQMLVAPGPSIARREAPPPPPPPPAETSSDEAWDSEEWNEAEEDAGDGLAEANDGFTLHAGGYAESEWIEPDANAAAPVGSADGYDDRDFGSDGDAPTLDITDDSLPAGRPAARPAAVRDAVPPASRAHADGQRSPSRSRPPPAGPGRERLAATPPDAGGAPGDGSALRQLDASDVEMARITEDLIDLLIGRNIINFTDFPTMAQRKLINRRALRSNMSALTNLVSDEEAIF